MTDTLVDIKEKLVNCLKSQMDSDLGSMDTHEAGEVVDMIKDLAEAEYYCAVTEAMKEGGEEPEGPYGYRGRAANGRYISRRGYTNPMPEYTMGYRPYVDQEPYVDAYLNDPDFSHKMREKNGKYGMAYQEYTDAKRHYTATNSMSDKDAMTIHANEHINDTLTTLRDIWKSADTDLKKRMKNDLTTLLNEMTI